MSNPPTQEDAINNVASIAQSAYNDAKMRELPDHECWRQVAIAMNNAVAMGLATNLIVPVETSEQGSNLLIVPGKTPRMVPITSRIDIAQRYETNLIAEFIQGFTNADVAGNVDAMVLDFVFTSKVDPNWQQHNTILMADIVRHISNRRIMELQMPKEGNA